MPPNKRLNFSGSQRSKGVLLLSAMVFLVTLRLHSQPGTLDPTFNPGNGVDLSVYSIAVLTSGQILIAGDFSSVNNVAFPGIARLNSDGTLDSTFNVSGFTRNVPIRGLALQSDGRIVIGGSFSSATGAVIEARYLSDKLA